jgi:hypothetical protein
LTELHHLNEWELGDFQGLYILWLKDDYCEIHNMYHMKSLYVGKGYIKDRFVDHWKTKNFSDELLIYWTYVKMKNRQIKYYEQLLMDIYKFPFNKHENFGTNKLCTYFTQTEVD